MPNLEDFFPRNVYPNREPTHETNTIGKWHGVYDESSDDGEEWLDYIADCLKYDSDD